MRDSTRSLPSSLSGLLRGAGRHAGPQWDTSATVAPRSSTTVPSSSAGGVDFWVAATHLPFPPSCLTPHPIAGYGFCACSLSSSLRLMRRLPQGRWTKTTATTTTTTLETPEQDEQQQQAQKPRKRPCALPTGQLTDRTEPTSRPTDRRNRTRTKDKDTTTRTNNGAQQQPAENRPVNGPPGFFLRRVFPAEGSFFPTSWFTFFLLLSYIFPRFEKLK